MRLPNPPQRANPSGRPRVVAFRQRTDAAPPDTFRAEIVQGIARGVVASTRRIRLRVEPSVGCCGRAPVGDNDFGQHPVRPLRGGEDAGFHRAARKAGSSAPRIRWEERVAGLRGAGGGGWEPGVPIFGLAGQVTVDAALEDAEGFRRKVRLLTRVELLGLTCPQAEATRTGGSCGLPSAGI